MAVKQLPKISDLPEPPDRLVGDQERFDVLTFNSLKAQKKMVNDDLNKTLIPALNQFAVDVNASVDAAALSERNAHDSEEVAKRKAGEASGSAGAAKVSEDNAKVSETNALASTNAAALSAESAESARIAAEAARDEAQDLANVGYVSEGHAGLAKVDGKTTQADAGGVITAKDVAIGGDLGDLVSARGLFNAKSTGAVDCNTLTNQGVYAIPQSYTTNGPGFPIKMLLLCSANSLLTTQLGISSGGSTDMAQRLALRNRNKDGEWSKWAEFFNSLRTGDGLKSINGIISVPEYEGATTSTSGTSGLVPPAAAGQQESFLTGGGEYKPAIPAGGIIMWSGSADAIPTGWALCDGTNGTPDLRGRFIVGAGPEGYEPGSVGGSDNVTPKVSLGASTTGIWTGAAGTGVTVQYTTLDTNTLPYHNHMVLEYAGVSNEFQSHLTGSTNGASGNYTSPTGASWGHTHGVTDPGHTHAIGDPGHAHTAAAAAFDNRPPYYALCLIMKL